MIWDYRERSMSGFRSHKWDPFLIISQIIAIQTVYYVGLGMWTFYITLFLKRTPSLDYLFSYDVRPYLIRWLSLSIILDLPTLYLEWSINYQCISSQCFLKVRKTKRIWLKEIRLILVLWPLFISLDDINNV